MSKIGLGIPRRADGQKRNWILSDEEYLTAPANILQALTNYEVKRNRVLAERTLRHLREDFNKLPQSTSWTWEAYRIDREVGYYEIERRRLPLLPRNAIRL